MTRVYSRSEVGSLARTSARPFGCTRIYELESRATKSNTYEVTGLWPLQHTRVSALPFTDSFNSPTRRLASSAREDPMLFCVRKKLLPASWAVTLLASRMVYDPMPIRSEVKEARWSQGESSEHRLNASAPGRIRFFRAWIEVASPDRTRTRADSSADCPDAAHSLQDHTVKRLSLIARILTIKTSASQIRTGAGGHTAAYDCRAAEILQSTLHVRTRRSHR